MTAPGDPGYWDHPDDRSDPWPPPDDTRHLEGAITSALYGHLFDAGHGWTIGGDRYEIADAVQYAVLGENPDAPGAPLIVARQSDGALFQLGLWASAIRTTPEQRDQDRRDLVAIREQRGGDPR